MNGKRQKVTRERFKSSDNFRAQVNVDQRVVAYMLGPLEDFSQYGGFRNVLANQMERLIVAEFQQKMENHAGFAGFVQGWADEYVEPELRAEFDAYVMAGPPKSQEKLL